MMHFGGTFWALVPAGLLTAMLGGLLSMAVIASDDPGFAIEQDYYRKAVAYDGELAQRSENARLGWRVQAESTGIQPGGSAAVSAKIVDGGAALPGARVRVEALRNASASRVFAAELRELTPGVYRAELPLARGGLWELRFTVERGQQRFTESVRLDIAEPAR